MTEVEKLPLPACCNRLVVLDEVTVAACCPKVVYFQSVGRQPQPQSQSLPTSSSPGEEVVVMTPPKRVDCCAPWHSPGAPLQECGLFYTVANKVLFCRNGAQEPHRDVLELPSNLRHDVEEMEVFFGTMLVLRSAEEILCYALDPATGVGKKKLPLIGRVQLPFDASETVSVVMKGFTKGGAERSISVVVYWRKAKCVHAFLLAVRSSHVTVQRRTCDNGLPIPTREEELRSCSCNWHRREVLLIFDRDEHQGISTRTLSLDSMEWVPFSITLPPRTRSVEHMHTGATWALVESCDGDLKLQGFLAGCVTHEVELPRPRDGGSSVLLTALGSSVYVLLGNVIFLVRVDADVGGEPTLCDWVHMQATVAAPYGKGGKKQQQQEIQEVVEFVRYAAPRNLTAIVRDYCYVSCAPNAVDVYHHAVLDAIEVQDNNGNVDCCIPLLRYVAVAQSLHPSTILRVLHVRDASLRLSISVLLAKKVPLMAGGVRRLEWGPPTRAFCKKSGRLQSKLFAAALYDTALTALSAGALGAVELLCAVADVVIVATLGSEKQHAGALIISRDEAEAEAAIAEALAVLTSYAQWALATAAPSLGIITAYVGPPRDSESCRKEAAIRDRVAHAIVTSRSVQIQALPLGRH